MHKKINLIFLIVMILNVNFALAQDVCVTKPGYFAAVTKQDFEKAVEYFVQKDEDALNKLMKTKMVFPLKGGIKVYVVKGGVFSGKIKIRPAGSTVEIWTFREAISGY
jgi:hypothetical protein